MAQTKIVLAECAPEYLATLERIFVREYKFTAEIVLLSNQQALESFFAQPKTIDILLINEALYDQSFVKHNVGHLFILAEEEPTPEAVGELFNNTIYKYVPAKTIIDSVISRTGISHSTNLHAGVAKVLMLFSPVGGAGQTTLAAGICTLIARNFRRALFIGADSLQAFGCIMKNPQYLQPGVEKTLQQKSKYAYKVVQPMIASELYDILPPFPAALASLGVTHEHLLFLIEAIKNSGDYDFIVIDASADFTEGTSKMMAFADQVLLLAEQDALAVHKLNCLLHNIDCSDKHRFALVCNKYQPSHNNHLQQNAEQAYPPIEYIEYDPAITPQNGDYIAGLQSVQQLGQFFL